MLQNIALGSTLMVLTTFIHAGCTMATVGLARRSQARHWATRSAGTREIMIVSIVLMMFFAALIEAALWAASYLWVGALSDFESALYFSTVTFTTLGYGDIVLDDRWRLLASFQAANGIVMFGWTTALIMAAVQRVYFPSKGR